MSICKSLHLCNDSSTAIQNNDHSNQILYNILEGVLRTGDRTSRKYDIARTIYMQSEEMFPWSKKGQLSRNRYDIQAQEEGRKTFSLPLAGGLGQMEVRRMEERGGRKGSQSPGRSSSNTITILQLTDFHFDAMYKEVSHACCMQ